ncbi:MULTISPECIES: transposase [Pseudomonas]|uniref:transposase n=1 Tax=Pseudomonas TaxID=286 RepID=UPI00370CCF8C
MNSPLIVNIGEHYQYYGKEFQVIDIRSNQIQLRSLQSNKVIMYQRYERLALEHHRGQFKKVQEAPFASVKGQVLATLSPSIKAILEMRYRFVAKSIDMWGGRLPKQGALDLAARISEETGDKAPCYTTLYNWLTAYLDAGENSLALIPKKRRADAHRFYRQPAEVQAIITANVELLWHTPTPCNQTALIDSIDLSLRTYNERLEADQRLPIPSRSTLYRILRDLDTYQIDKHQLPLQEALKKQHYSKKCTPLHRRLELVEGDTHLLDVQICDESGELIGRPWLTVLLDVKTRIIVGWDISFNPPSAEKTLRALKTSLLRNNPYGGLALYYRVDNGAEFIANRIKEVLSLMGSHITFCEPGGPNKKPHVERFFRIWTTNIVHTMRGTTFSSPRRYDSEGNAIYTIQGVREIFTNWIEKVYHPRHHKSLNMSAVEAWEKAGASNREFPLKKYDEEDLKSRFLQVAYVTPNNGRLRFNDLAWTFPAVAYLATKNRHSKTVRLLYDESELGIAWVSIPEQPSQIWALEAVSPEYQTGLTMHLHNEIKKSNIANMEKDNYRAAIDARTLILHKIALENKSKRSRKNKAKAVESGDFKALLPQHLSRPESHDPSFKAITGNSHYHIHPRTPGDYSVREVSDESD